MKSKRKIIHGGLYNHNKIALNDKYTMLIHVFNNVNGFVVKIKIHINHIHKCSKINLITK